MKLKRWAVILAGVTLLASCGGGGGVGSAGGGGAVTGSWDSPNSTWDTATWGQ